MTISWRWHLACSFSRRTPAMLLALLLAVLLAVLPASARTVVRVGHYENKPKIYTMPDGEHAGLFPDLLAYVAAREGWELAIIPGSWTECLDRLERGEIDVMPDVAWSRERADKFSFGEENVLVNWACVYVPRGGQLESLLDLNGKRVAVMRGNVHTTGEDGIYNLAKRFEIACTFVETDSLAGVFQLLAEGKADAGVVNRLYGMQYERDYPVAATSIIFGPSQLKFAFPQNGRLTALLRPAIDRHLHELKARPDSQYYRLIDQYFAVGLMQEPEEVAPEWLRGAVLTVLLLLAMLLFGIYVLRRQVRLATAGLQAANQALEEERAALERRVEQRTAELRVAKDHAESADRLKSAFLATMSHELRTPLNSIIGFTGLVLQELPGPLNAEQRKQLEMVRGSARHLLALINDVLDISKIEAGQMTVARAPFALDELLRGTLHSVLPLAEKKGLQLTMELSPAVATVTGDERRVRQVLMNLLSNAIKFTERGGVFVQAGMQAGMVAISVRDTGIGIRPEDMAVLFRPFSQVDNSLTRRHEGTGLGLSICQRLLELMGGGVAVHSTYGEGSTFTMTLPVEEKRT